MHLGLSIQLIYSYAVGTSPATSPPQKFHEWSSFHGASAARPIAIAPSCIALARVASEKHPDSFYRSRDPYLAPSQALRLRGSPWSVPGQQPHPGVRVLPEVPLDAVVDSVLEYHTAVVDAV